MSTFDKIIGYGEIKQELIRIADTLKNWEIYKSLGAASPRGLLLYGEPGVGKSLMAKCLMEASGREVFACRKTEPDGEFVKTIKETFDRAAEHEPSIVFLDDMDKFANDDEGHRDSEEFVTVQSCIDEVKGREVFVLATANAIHKLPRSLVRAGRFDRRIEVDTPDAEDAKRIIGHYLAQKKLTGDLDYAAIAAILSGRSCASLETVINEAALLAGYQRAEHVTMDHIMEASLRIVHGIPHGSHIPVDLNVDGDMARSVYHEAGHAVVSELFSPGSASLVIAWCGAGGKNTGVTTTKNSNDLWGLNRCERDIMVCLAGRAAIELRFGAFDTGSARDLDDAFDTVMHLVQNLCYSGFDLYSYRHREDSQTLSGRQETAIAATVEQYYRRVKELLNSSRDFLEATAHALAEKGVLTAADIQAIRKNCSASESVA